MQKMQEMEQLTSMQGLLTSRSTVDKTMGTHYAINNQRNSNHDTVSRATLSGSAAAAALAFSSYQNMLIRQNSSNSLTPISFQQEASSSNNSNQCHGYNLSRSSQNFQVNGFSSPHQLQQHSLNSNGLLQQTQQHAHQSSQDLQQKMIQQLLQNTSSNNGPSGQKNSVSGQIGNRNSAAYGFGFGNNETGKTAAKLTKTNSFKSASSSDSPATGGGSHGFNQKATELPHGHHLADEMVPDITHDFEDNGFFTSDLDDAMGYGWKA